MGEYNVSIFNIAYSVGRIADLVDSQLTGHHRRVAYIAGRIAEELGLTTQERDEMVLAGLVHDVGALSTQDRVDIFDFKGINGGIHAEKGYKLLSILESFKDVAVHVRYHHIRWDEYPKQEEMLGGNILYLADRVDVLAQQQRNILLKSEEIRTQIIEERGKMFNPKVVEAFMRISKNEAFWLDSMSAMILAPRCEYYKNIAFTEDVMIQMGLFFSQIIDFRCRFTATHSSGIAAVASELAKLRAYSQYECTLMRFAGFVHDIGKLAVPIEIIEKPDKLTDEEYSIMKIHPYYTYQILSHIEGIGKVKEWAAYHHENIKGTGYPFGIQDSGLDEGCKIMKVADIFTALTEERPYREPMKSEKVLEIFKRVEQDEEDEEFSCLVEVLKQNYDNLVAIREAAQRDAIRRYQVFIE